MPDLVGNPEDRFSNVAAHILIGHPIFTLSVLLLSIENVLVFSFV